MAWQQFGFVARFKLIMQGLVSVAVLSAALYVILSGSYPGSHDKWAFGIIGVVVGYWLR